MGMTWELEAYLGFERADISNELLSVSRDLGVGEQELEGLETVDGLHVLVLLRTRPNQEAGPSIRKGASKHRNTVVHTAWVAVQDLLGDESPSVDLLGDSRRNSTSTLVGDMNVSGGGDGGATSSWWLVGDADTPVQDEEGCCCADGERS